MAKFETDPADYARKLDQYRQLLAQIKEWREDPRMASEAAFIDTMEQQAKKLWDMWLAPDEKADPHAICAKWVRKFGLGFHPDTRGADYTPALDAEEIAEYEKDMDDLFDVAADPYECAMMAMADYGLLSDEEAAQWKKG